MPNFWIVSCTAPRRMELIGQRMLDGVEVLKLYQQAQRVSLRKLKPSCRRLLPLCGEIVTLIISWVRTLLDFGWPTASLML